MRVRGRGLRVLKRFLLLSAIVVLSACVGPPKLPAAPEGGEPPKVGGIAGVLAGIRNLIPKKEKPPAAVPARLLGSIRQVNEEGRFVLLDAITPSALQADDQLVTLADKTQTSELKLTSLRSGSFFIADITSGKPGVGDRVFKK